ncbi:MAG: hypothetical protein KC618_08780, partial [Candidatus Omnitrophica bacterium]|nr:hypothetical protein [Candidatus Omnitrophota bacterium]
MRRFLLTAIFCFFVISSAFSDQTYSVIEAIQRKFQQQTAFAFLDIRLPAPNILQLSFRGKLFDPAQYGP